VRAVSCARSAATSSSDRLDDRARKKAAASVFSGRVREDSPRFFVARTLAPPRNVLARRRRLVTSPFHQQSDDPIL